MTNHLSNIPLLTLLALFLGQAACAPDGGGQIGEEGALCAPVDSIELAPTDISPLGFSPMQLLETVEGSHQNSLRWADGATTEVTAVLTFSGDATYHDREWIDSNASDGIEPALETDLGDCPDIVELETQLSFATADGAFDESWTVTMQAPTVDLALVSRTLDAPSGTFEAEEYAPVGDWDVVSAHLTLSIGPDGLAGVIAGMAEFTEGDIASATFFDVAEFGSAQGE